MTRKEVSYMKKLLFLAMVMLLVLSFSSCFLIGKVPMTLLIDDTHNNSYDFDGYGSEDFFEKLEAIALAEGYSVSYSSSAGFSPEKYGVVLIAAPATSYTTQDKSKVKSLLDKGGKVILLGEWYWYYDNTLLNSIASYVGSNITFANYQLSDSTNNYQSTSSWLTTTEITAHAVTSGLNKLALFASTALNVSGSAQIVVHAESTAGTASTFSLDAGFQVTSVLSSEVDVAPSVTNLGLVAVSEVGGGKVVAVTDATLFANDVYSLITGDYIDVHDNAALFKNILNW